MHFFENTALAAEKQVQDNNNELIDSSADFMRDNDDYLQGKSCIRAAVNDTAVKGVKLFKESCKIFAKYGEEKECCGMQRIPT